MKQTKYLFDEQQQTPEGMVSVSQLQTFMSCKKKWVYNYIEGLTPRVERAYLTIGKLCHKGMQTAMQELWKDRAAGLDTTQEGGLFGSWRSAGIKAMGNEWREYIDNTPVLAEEMPDFVKMLDNAVSIFCQAFKEFEPWKYEVLTLCDKGKFIPALELHFVVPCAPSKGLHGYIDAILRDRTTGFVWCTDYKFRKSLSPDEEEAVNIQNAVYLYACKKMGVDITGTMTWQHVNAPAATPTLLKNGTVSRAKIKTTWEMYSEFCRMNNIDPASYKEEMQDKLADIEWCRATYEYRNDETIKRIWAECVVPTTREVKKATNPKANNYRSMYPWNCKMCQYQNLCQAELRGYDIEAKRLTEFTKRTRIIQQETDCQKTD